MTSKITFTRTVLALSLAGIFASGAAKAGALDGGTASTADSVAIGGGSLASNAGTATGNSATAIGGSGTATGSAAMASNGQSTATGAGASATGNASTAHGSGAQAIANFTTATGYSAFATTSGATADGSFAWARAQNSVVLGYTSEVKAAGTGSISVGANNSVTGVNNIAIGNNIIIADPDVTGSVAIGQGSQVSASNEVSMGTAGQTRTISNVTAGVNAKDAVNKAQMDVVAATAAAANAAAVSAQADAATALTAANAAQTTATNTAAALVVTNAAVATAQGNITTLGADLSALTAAGIVPGASRTGLNSISLGAGSNDSGAANVLAIGARKITGMVDGVAATDGATAGQVATVTSNLATTNTNLAATTTTANSAAAAVVVADAKAVAITTTWNAFVAAPALANGLAVTSTNGKASSGVSNTSVSMDWTDAGDPNKAASVTVSAGKVVLSGGDPNTVTVDGTGIYHQLEAGSQWSALNAASKGVVVNDAGVKVTPATTVDMGGNRVQNVATATAPTDAVNLQQLTAAIAGAPGRVSALESRVAGIESQIADLAKKAYAGTASAMAMAQPVYLSRRNRTAVAFAGASYLGQNATAITLSHLVDLKCSQADRVAKTCVNVVVSAGLSASSGGSGMRAGVSIGF